MTGEGLVDCSDGSAIAAGDGLAAVFKGVGLVRVAEGVGATALAVGRAVGVSAGFNGLAVPVDVETGTLGRGV